MANLEGTANNTFAKAPYVHKEVIRHVNVDKETFLELIDGSLERWTLPRGAQWPDKLVFYCDGCQYIVEVDRVLAGVCMLKMPKEYSE